MMGWESGVDGQHRLSVRHWFKTVEINRQRHSTLQHCHNIRLLWQYVFFKQQQKTRWPKFIRRGWTRHEILY